MYLGFGMRVIGADCAAAGQLDRVLVDPGTRQVTHVVVRSPNVSEEVLLPLRLVQGEADGGPANAEEALQLAVPAGDLEHMPRYYDGRWSSPPAGRVDAGSAAVDRHERLAEVPEVPENAVELGPSTQVMLDGASAGVLIGLATGVEDDRLAELWVAGIDGQGLMIPAAAIVDLTDTVIRVNPAAD